MRTFYLLVLCFCFAVYLRKNTASSIDRHSQPRPSLVAVVVVKVTDGHQSDVILLVLQGVAEVATLNETGELRRIFRTFKVRQACPETISNHVS